MALNNGQLTDEQLNNVLINATLDTIEYITDQISKLDNKQVVFRKDPHGQDHKPTLVLDVLADGHFSDKIYDHARFFSSSYRTYDEYQQHKKKFFSEVRISSPHQSPIRVIGEERYKEELDSLRDELRPVVISDPIDGSDLLERGLSNWCTAAVMFFPKRDPGKRIVSATVGIYPGIVYYARPELDTPRRMEYQIEDVEPSNQDFQGIEVSRGDFAFRGMARETELAKASVCYYGQKIENFISMPESKLSKKIAELNEEVKSRNNKRRENGDAGKEHFLFRLYNLAGIPMMMKLADHDGAGQGINAIIELRGQQVHDVIPGLYIAIKAGACAKDLQGNRYTIESLEEALLQPNMTKLTYVLASTEELADEILRYLA